MHTVSSSELLRNLSNNTELPHHLTEGSSEQNIAGSVSRSTLLLMRLLSRSPSPFTIYQRGVLKFRRVGLRMRWLSPPQVPCVVGAGRDTPEDDSPPSRWACLSALKRRADRCLRGWRCSRSALQHFHLCLVPITSTASAGARAFKHPECFLYRRFIAICHWEVAVFFI